MYLKKTVFRYGLKITDMLKAISIKHQLESITIAYTLVNKVTWFSRIAQPGLANQGSRYRCRLWPQAPHFVWNLVELFKQAT